jgi:hypothetical protein
MADLLGDYQRDSRFALKLRTFSPPGFQKQVTSIWEA